MKLHARHIALVLAAMAALACVKQTPEEAPAVLAGLRADAVDFAPAVLTPRTKAPAFSGGVYNTSESFGVYGFTLGKDGTNDVYGVHDSGNTYLPEFMVNEGISLQDGMWQAGKDFFWPKKKRVAFFAYSPYYAYGTDNMVASRRWARFYKDSKRFCHHVAGVTIANDIPGGKKDLLFSDIALNFNNYADGLTNLVSNGTATDYTGVPVLFRHAFCKVKFQARLSKTQGEDLGTQEFPPILGEVLRPDSGRTRTNNSTTVTETATTAEVGGNVIDATMRTTVTQYTVVQNVSQEVTTVTISGRRTWSGQVTSFSVSQVGSKGDLELYSAPLTDDFTNNNAVLQWDFSYNKTKWDIKTWKNLNMGSAKTLGTSATVMVQDVLIPMKQFESSGSHKNEVTLAYNISTVPETTVRETRTDTWTETTDYTETIVQIFKKNTSEEIDDPRKGTTTVADGATVVSARTQGPVTDTSGDGGNTTLYFNYTFPLDGLGGISAWGLGEDITYTFVIEPTNGIRIYWDPAQVTTWTVENGTQIDL